MSIFLFSVGKDENILVAYIILGMKKAGSTQFQTKNTFLFIKEKACIFLHIHVRIVRLCFISGRQD